MLCGIPTKYFRTHNAWRTLSPFSTSPRRSPDGSPRMCQGRTTEGTLSMALTPPYAIVVTRSPLDILFFLTRSKYWNSESYRENKNEIIIITDLSNILKDSKIRHQKIPTHHPNFYKNILDSRNQDQTIYSASLIKQTTLDRWPRWTREEQWMDLIDDLRNFWKIRKVQKKF